MKKILITFILSFVGFISFCSAVYYNSVRIIDNSTALEFPVGNSSKTYTLQAGHLLTFDGEFGSRLSCSISGTNISSSSTLKGFVLINNSNSSLDVIFNCNNSFSASKRMSYIDVDISSVVNCPTCEECEECQECPVIDSEYCENNNLCSSSSCSGDSRSALYINEIQHEGAGTINITIPEEFNWDYTNDNDVFDLDIEGYNVDTEYIDGIIRTQNYKPTSEDFTRLVGMLAPYSKYLIFLLFMFIIWAWIKKPFKSKKL